MTDYDHGAKNDFRRNCEWHGPELDVERQALP